MRVPSHQVRNVLEAYKKLIIKMHSGSNLPGDFEPSVLAKKRTTVLASAMTAMAARLLKSKEAMESADADQHELKGTVHCMISETQLAYNCINGNNKKTSGIITIRNDATHDEEKDFS
jgi:hypothetical protein